MQGGKEQALRRIRYTPQGNANAANAAGGILMVDQGGPRILDFLLILGRIYVFYVLGICSWEVWARLIWIKETTWSSSRE